MTRPSFTVPPIAAPTNVHSFAIRNGHLLLDRRVAVLLTALFWSSLVHGGEIHAAAMNRDLAKDQMLAKGNPESVRSKDNIAETLRRKWK